MTMKKYSLPKRIIAMLLSLVMVLSLMPAIGLFTAANAAGTGSGVIGVTTDPHTLNAWQDKFLPDGVISTEHAGGIWTDKSVLTGGDIAAAFPGVSGLNVGSNNFLVSLSALAANSVVVGQGATPTDTVFVLDISGSMSQSELNAMVRAANDAIATLLANEDNRVGIILYSTNAHVLLPLGRYTSLTDNNGTPGDLTDDFQKYIEADLSGYGGSVSGDIMTARNMTGTQQTQVWVEGHWEGRWPNRQWVDGHYETQEVEVYEYLQSIAADGTPTAVDTSISVSGGTYIQGGLWAGWQQFNNASLNAGEARTPVMVLMSDGAPTWLTNDFNNVPADYEYGTGNTSNKGDGFVTQLTAAYVKEKMAQKYSVGSFKATAYFYTLGLGVDSVTNSEIAKAVLDPVNSQYNGIAEHWTDYYALNAGETMTVTLGRRSDYNNNTTVNVSVGYDATVDFENADEYVNKYFPASDASQLSTAFRGIVNEISLNAGYYVTRLDGTNANDGGYVTFVDEIGTGMQVKDIKGILIGTTLYTGERLAKALVDGSFGNTSSATELGDNMVWAVKQRLRIQDQLDGAGNVVLTATEIARSLLNSAYAAGQLSCTLDPNGNVAAYSNYIGWFGDASGNYIGFWDAENPNAVIPENAVYANKCYGMLGSTTDGQTTHASDLMYVAVQVSKPVTEIAGEKVIETKSPETVTFRIPASLLPLITYQIEVEAENMDAVDENTEVTVTYQGANPIRLLYEVGVHSELNGLNIHDFVRENYQAKNADGDYYLYTNAWYWEPDSGVADYNNPPTADNALSYVLRDTAKNHITYAYFEPGEDNEHYYFNSDTTIYYLDGSTYKPVPVSATLDTTGATQYYFKHVSYTATESGVQDKSDVAIHYGKIDKQVIENHATKNGSKWYIPAGTMHYATIHDHNEDKVQNKTESFFARLHQLVDIAVDGDTSHHYEIVYMGNNGRITYAPYQGIKLSKVMNDGSKPNASFDFTVALTPAVGETLAAAYDTVHVAADGTETTGSAAVNGGSITVSLKPGESIYILNIATGTEYTITEGTQHDYAQHSATNTNGTIAENVITESVFTNMVQEYGALTVTKAVTYLDNTQATAEAANNKFPVTVTLTRNGAPFTGTVFVGSTSTSVTNGTVNFEIVDGQSVIISDIPVGVTYVVDEGALPARYTQTNAADPTGTIDVDGETALLTNQYDPESVTINPVYPAIRVNVHKDLRNSAGANIDWPAGASFTFELLRYVPATGTEPAKWDTTGKFVTLTKADYDAAKASDPAAHIISDELSLEGIPFDKAGDYLFRLSEVDAGALGTTYDTTDHDFRVIVTDTDLDGALEISKVEVIDPETGLEQNQTGNWEIGATYINIYEVGTASLALETGKSLTGREMKDGEFTFTLTGLNGAPMPVGTTGISVTMPNGKLGHVVFPAIVYTDADIGQTYKYTIEEVDGGLGGVNYDKSKYEVTVVVGSDTVNHKVTAAATYKRIADAQGNAVDETVTAQEVRFANTYAAASTTVTLTGTKNLTGKNIENGMFGFVLTPVTAGAPMSANGTVTNTGNSFTFGEIEFTAAGTYQYTITEANGGTTVGGMTYDGTVYNVTVEVTDNGAGQLLAATTINGAATTSVSFHNRYDAADATVTLGGTKVVRNDTPNSATAISPVGYRFQLKQGNTVVDTAVSGTGGSFTFDALTFDAEGTYTYTVSEVTGTVPGVNYDAPNWNVTIEVRDNNGVLEARINGGTYSNTASANNSFINTYVAEDVSVTLAALKVLSGRDLWENEFDFTLKAMGNAPMPAGAVNGELTVSNQASGAVLFGDIHYSAAGTYVYTVTEQQGNIPGITYSQTVFTVTVTVTDGGIGQLAARIAYSSDIYGDADLVQFFNSYSTTPVKIELAGSQGGLKELEDLTSAAQNQYTVANTAFDFTLTALNGAPMPAGAANGAITVKNGTDGTFTFGQIEYSGTGVYEYLVTEVNGGVNGMTYDDTQYKVVVTVTDEVKDGVLEVAVKYYEMVSATQLDEKPRLVFENSYQAQEASVTFVGQKTFNGGRDLKENEFSFTLTGPNIAGGSETVKNAASGSFTFSKITFTKEGTYVYELVEVEGSDEQVTYDTTKYQLTVTVADDNGELKATTRIDVVDGAQDVESYGFTNIFAPTDASVDVTVQKVLVNNSGETMGLNGFEFQLVGVEKPGTATVKSDDTGAAKFTLTFGYEDIGETFTYKLSEVNTAIERMTYDETVYEIKVAVGQNHTTGEITLTVTRNGESAAEAAVFTNTYAAKPPVVPPAPPVNPDGPPKTGDTFNLGGWAALMGVSAICLLAVLVIGRKELFAK